MDGRVVGGIWFLSRLFEKSVFLELFPASLSDEHRAVAVDWLPAAEKYMVYRIASNRRPRILARTSAYHIPCHIVRLGDALAVFD